MVSSITTNTKITQTPSEEKKKDNDFFRFFEKWGEQLDFIRLPNKVIGTWLGWAEYMLLPSQPLSLITDRRLTIKAVTSTFAIPKFFIKQVKLFETCYDLKNKLSAKPAGLGKIIEDVKKTFLAFLAAITATIKVPQILDKTRIFDLNKISRALPTILAKSECLLSLGLYGMKVIDTGWTLCSQLKRKNRSLADRKWSSSPKVTKSLQKLGSNSLKVISNSFSAAALFLGSCANPLASLVISILSVIASLLGKIGCRSDIFWKDSKRAEDAFASLPA